MNGTWQPNGFFLTKRVVVCKKDQWQMVGTLKCIPSLPLVPASLFSRHGKTRRLPKWCEFALDTGESPFSPSKSSRDETTSKGENAFSFLSTSASTIKDIQCGETWHIQLPNNKKKELDYWQKANKTCKQDKLALSLPSFAGETLLLCCILYYPTLHKLYEKSLGEESGRSWNESFFFCPNKIVRCLRLMMAIQVGPPMVHWLINGAFLLLPFRKSLASISSQGQGWSSILQDYKWAD